MKCVDITEARNVHAGRGHYHWSCSGYGFDKKRYVSKPYYYGGMLLSSQDGETHAAKYGHESRAKLYYCNRNCK